MALDVTMDTDVFERKFCAPRIRFFNEKMAVQNAHDVYQKIIYHR